MKSFAIAVSLLFLFSNSVTGQDPIGAPAQLKFLDKLPDGQDKIFYSNRLGVDIVAGENGLSTVYYAFPAQLNAELIDFLKSKNTQQQIELSEKQKLEYKAIRSEFRAAVSEIEKRFPELKDKGLSKEKRNRLNQTIHLESEKLKKKFSEKVKDLLVPHQVSTIQGIKFSQFVQLRGFKSAISNAPFSKILKTSDQQKQELEQIDKETKLKIKKLHEELQKSIQELQKDSKSKMLKVLSPGQRRQVRKLEGAQNESSRN